MSAQKAPLRSDEPTSPAVVPSALPEAEVGSPFTRFIDSIAFVLSAVLSPYIVIPVGTIGMVWARTTGTQFWPWVTVSLLFSTLLPALYVVVGIKRGLITDVHVMEREQRNGPFSVAIIGSLIAVVVLRNMGAPPSVWGLSLVLSVNGAIIYLITLYTKISVHVSVLSATVLGAVMLNPDMSPFSLLWLVPPLIWARTRRGRHSVWQGISGCVVASIVTTLTLHSIGLGARVSQFIDRLF